MNITEKTFENFIWIDILDTNRHKLEIIAQRFELDLFQIKDSIQLGHLPKIEKLEKYNFLILRAFTVPLIENKINITELTNKVAFFYNSSKIITIHRAKFGFLETVKDKYDSTEDFLVSIIYKMIQTYENPSQTLSTKNDQIEKTIFLPSNKGLSLEELYFQKAQTRVLRKLLQITQNVINQIDISDSNKVPIQDIKDTILRLLLEFEENIENSNALLHTFLSVNAQKNNDVMRVLTIFSVFFLPLTFIAGIYGMNFSYMPELSWKWGYFGTLLTMLIVSIGIFIGFKFKKIL